MASLMQEFAEARKRRLLERTSFLVDCQLASEARQEEIQNRSNQVSQYLQELSIARGDQAIEDSAERAQDVRTRTFKTRSLLKHIHKARIRASNADRMQRLQVESTRLTEAESDRMQRLQVESTRLAEAEADRMQRQQLVKERAAFTQIQIEEFTETRLANGTLAAQQRAQVEANRLADAQDRALRLSAFRSQLKNSVWGSLNSLAATDFIAKMPAKSSPDISDKLNANPKTKVAVQVSELAVSEPAEVKHTFKETPKASGKIEQFVVDYVAQLSTNSSLLEVVNDRDTVRDLLAQGANTLKVDPSDILNTLLQMAEGS